MSDISQFDQVEHFWCPQLGQTITFSYCRQVQQGLPCSRVVVCFSPHFDVAAFIEEHYTPEQREVFLGPQPGRLDRVLDALEQSRKDKPGDDS